MQEGGLGTQRIVIRGQGARAPFTSNRLRAYLGAIPLTDGTGATDLEDVDLRLLDGIDIIRGPASSAYGAGLGGVIKLRPAYGVATGFGGSLQATTGNFGMLRAGAQLRYGGQGLQVNGGYLRTQWDGFRQNGSYQRDNASLLLTLKDRHSRQDRPPAQTHLQAYYTAARNEIASSLGATALVTDPRQAGGSWGRAEGFERYKRWALGVQRMQQLGENTELVYSAFAKTRQAYEPRPFNILEEQNWAAGGRGVLTAKLSEAWRTSLGAEVFAERYAWTTTENRYADFPEGTGSVAGQLLSSTREHRYNLHGFGEASWRAGPVGVTAGLSVGRVRYRLADRLQASDTTATYTFGTQLSPRLAVRYRLSKTLTVYGQLARGYAAPTVDETLTASGAPNPDIEAETGWNTEIGLRTVSPDRRYVAQVVGYHLRTAGILVARQIAPDQFVGLNGGDTRQWGLEVEGRIGFGPQTAGTSLDAVAYRMSLHAAYALQAHRFGDFVDGPNDFSGKALTGVPSHQSSIGLALVPARGWQLYTGLLHRGDLPVDDGNTTTAEAYVLLNASLRYTPPAIQRFSLEAGGSNLLDATYISMVAVNARGFGGREPRYFYPGVPRRLWVGLKYTW